MFVVLSPLASAKVGVISLRCLIGSVFVCAPAHITATVFVFCAPSKVPLQRQGLVGWLVFVLKLRCLSHSLIKYPLIALLLCGFFFVPVKWGGVGGWGELLLSVFALPLRCFFCVHYMYQCIICIALLFKRLFALLWMRDLLSSAPVQFVFSFVFTFFFSGGGGGGWAGEGT